MSTVELQPETGKERPPAPAPTMAPTMAATMAPTVAPPVAPPAPASPAPRKSRWRFHVLRILGTLVRVLATLIVVVIAAALSWAMWKTYMGTPWTRDGRVRVYVVTIAPQVAGIIAQLPIADDQFVHKGDLLLEIDPTNYTIAVDVAKAAVARTKAIADNAQTEAKRDEFAQWASQQEQQTSMSKALAAQAEYQQMQGNLRQAQVNLERTRITSPVNGYVTNLKAQLGDYVTVGEHRITLVNSDSFWVDGYFEETVLDSIHEGAPAVIKLMGYRALLHGHVAGVARGINVPDAASNAAGLAEVDPIFTWVRLAQRVPVRIALDEVPSGVRLVAGMTGTVQVDPLPGRTRSMRDALASLYDFVRDCAAAVDQCLDGFAEPQK
jgi:RND family efflux transporter MFP subunit